MFKKLFIPALFVLVMCSCGSDKTNTNDSKQLELEINLEEDMSLELSENAEEDVIFYNLLYPMDLGVVLDNKGSFYDSGLLNPLNNISNYQNSRQFALALGVFGADLSYLWVFDQSQQALSYFTAIKQLAYEMGIPESSVQLSAIRAEKYSDNIDSLIYIARESYQATDEYLQNSGNEDLAVLILLGGWIESLNTSLSLYKEANERMALKILSQKYSLASLINLLNEHESNEDLVKYNKKLFVLLNEFDELQNKHLSDHLQLDTIKKSIKFRTQGNLNINANEFDKLRTLIGNFRNDIIK